MRTAGSSTVEKRGSPYREPWIETPWTETNWTETPLGRDPLDRDPPKKEHGTRDRDPQERTWDQAARQEVTSYRDPPSPREQNDTHFWNITLR